MRTTIARGVALLDQCEGPHWVSAIELEKLDLTSYSTCVLGQLYGNYDDGLRELEIGSGTPFGFLLDKGNWAYLTRDWKATIRRLKKERGWP